MTEDTVVWIESAAGFEELVPEWDAVAARTGYPFMRHAWLTSWWRAFSGDRRLLVCTARRGGKLVAAFPLARRRGVVTAPANAHTPTFVPIAVDGSALATVVDAVVGAAFPSLVVGPLPADAEAVERLAEASRRAGRRTWIQQAHASPVVDVRGTAEAYRGRLARSTRRELDRLRRKLEREHDVSFETLAQPEDVLSALERGLEVERGGWKGRRGTAILSSAATATFYREVATRFAAHELLRLSTLAAGERLVAFDFGIVADEALWLPKGGYDESFGRYAPGLLLLLAEIERAHELGLARVELLGAADAYKLKFATRVRDHVVVHSSSSRPAAVARTAYARFGRPAARSVYRRVLRRSR